MKFPRGCSGLFLKPNTGRPIRLPCARGRRRLSRPRVSGRISCFRGKARTMRTDLSVRAEHRGDMRVDVHLRDRILPFDYPIKAGGDPTPLETLLASLAACAGATLHS